MEGNDHFKVASAETKRECNEAVDSAEISGAIFSIKVNEMHSSTAVQNYEN